MIQEHWLRYFCEKEEKEALLAWMAQEGLSRPRAFEERVAHAEKLRKLGNDWYNKDDFRRALHCLMGAVYTLDWMPTEQMGQSEEQRAQVSELMLPVMSNVTMVFLKRGDFANAEKAATCGLRCATKLPAEETVALRAKLHYRRGLARGQDGPGHDFDGARADLVEAAKLEPSNHEIRKCLENCKVLRTEERKKDPIRYQARERAAPMEEQESTGDAAETESGATGPPGLPPLLEKFAEVVGRCLGKSRRAYRNIRQGQLITVMRDAFHYRIAITSCLIALLAILIGYRFAAS